MVVFDDVSKEKLFFYPHTIEWKDGKIPIAQKADYQVIPVEFAEPLKQELSHFIECVIQRKRPLTDGSEGIRVLKILEQAEKSIANSRGNQSTSQLLNLLNHTLSTKAPISTKMLRSVREQRYGISHTF